MEKMVGGREGRAELSKSGNPHIRSQMYPLDSGGVSRNHGGSIILPSFSWGYLLCHVAFLVYLN